MERKIGETFEYEGKTFIVKEDNNYSCHGCVFNKRCTLSVKKMTGECKRAFRKDNKDVVFSEVQEQHTEEPKERKIGEVFEFEGKKLKVVETKDSTCYNCYFANRDCDCESARKVLGACLSETRTDKKPVIFVEAKEEAEEPEEQMQEESQKLNLCEILKHCPVGEPFWSPMLGDVKFFGIDQTMKRVCVTSVSNVTRGINADGTVKVDGVTSPEIMLYPSREQRDWTKVKYKPKKERFDPKTLQPFDKVLVRDDYKEHWLCRFFSHIVDGIHIYKYTTIGSAYKYCIPYNDDTKHLVGTRDEAPEFYKYWED